MLYHNFLKIKKGAAAAIFSLPALLFSQNPLPENEAIQRVLKTHPAVAAAEKTVEQRQVLTRAATIWEPAQIYQNVAADPDLGLFGTTSVGVQQNFPNRKLTSARRNFYEKNVAVAEAERQLTQKQVVRQVREVYRHLGYLDDRRRVLARLDSLFSKTEKIATTRHAAGDADRAESLAARDRAAQIRLERQTVGHEIQFDREVLGRILGEPGAVEPLVEPMRRTVFSLADTVFLKNSAAAQLSLQQVERSKSEVLLEKSRRGLSFSGAAFGQVLGDGQFFPGWQIGLNVPLARRSLARHAQAAELAAQSAEAAHRAHLLDQSTELAHLLHEQEKYEIMLDYYETAGKTLAAELLRSAELNYQNGETDYLDFVKMTEQAAKIELDFIENLYGQNLTVLALQALVER